VSNAPRFALVDAPRFVLVDAPRFALVTHSPARRHILSTALALIHRLSRYPAANVRFDVSHSDDDGDV